MTPKGWRGLVRAIPLTFKRARKLRREMTAPEVVLWSALRGSKIGVRFRRQHPIEPFILDFYCPSAKIAVEIDGEGHGHPDQAAHDRARDRRLDEQGVRVMRFSATDVMDEESRASTLAEIAAAARSSSTLLGVGEGDREAVEGAAAEVGSQQKPESVEQARTATSMASGGAAAAPSTPSGFPSPASRGRI